VVAQDNWPDLLFRNGGQDGPDARLIAAAPALLAECVRLRAVERETRMALWAGHGHEGIYGDDGEMQCGACAPASGYPGGLWDYRRESLPALAKHVANMAATLRAQVAALEREARGNGEALDGAMHTVEKLTADAARLREQRDRLAEAGRVAQWGYIGDNGHKYCPVCLNSIDRGHTEDCVLGKALAAVEPATTSAGEPPAPEAQR
jgi:hypothetical protein